MIKKYFALLLGLVLILGLSWRVQRTAKVCQFHFVDEEDHIAGADLINRGYKLHEQIQSKPPALVYFSSAAIQKLARPEQYFYAGAAPPPGHVWFTGPYGVCFWPCASAGRAGFCFILRILKIRLAGQFAINGIFGGLSGGLSAGCFPCFQAAAPAGIDFLGSLPFLIVFNLVLSGPGSD